MPIIGVNRDPIRLPLLEAFGHSFVRGPGGTSPRVRWTTRLAGLLDAKELNYGVSGGRIAQPENGTNGMGGFATTLQVLPRGQSSTPLIFTPQSSAVVIQSGINDLNAVGTAVFPMLKHALRTSIARVVAAKVFESQDASCTYTGTWTVVANAAAESSGTGSPESYRTAAASNAVVTIAVPASFPGGSITFGFHADPASGANGVTIAKTAGAGTNGTIVTNYTVAGSGVASTGGANGVVYRVNNLQPGAHTFTLTTVWVSGTIGFDYWSIDAPMPPLVAVVDQWRLTGTQSGNLVDANITAMNTQMQSVVNEFGPSVVWVATDAAANKSNYYINTSDNLHPTDAGHALIAQLVLAAFQNIWQTMSDEYRMLLSMGQQDTSTDPQGYMHQGQVKAWIPAFLSATAGGTTWLVPSAKTEFLGGIGSIPLNMTGYEQYRLYAHVLTAQTGGYLGFEVSPIFGWTDMTVGTANQISVAAAGTLYTPWQDIPANMKRGEVPAHIYGVSGSGATGAKFGPIMIQLR